LGVFPQEVISVTAVDTPYPFFLDMGDNAFYDHEGFIVEFRVRAFLQDLPISVEFAGVHVPNQAAVKTIHFTDLDQDEIMIVHDVDVTPRLIPLNTSGATLKVRGRDFVFGRYREAVRLWAVPRLMPPFKEKCSFDSVKQMWLTADIARTPTRTNTTSVGNPLSVRQDPLGESCTEYEVTNMCRTTVVTSDQELECELLPALGSHVDVYLQIYTQFTQRLAVLETERISIRAASIDLTAHNITFEGVFVPDDPDFVFFLAPDGNSPRLPQHGIDLCEAFEVTVNSIYCAIKHMEELTLDLLRVPSARLVVYQIGQVAFAPATLIFPKPLVYDVQPAEVDDVCCHDMTLTGFNFGWPSHGLPVVKLDETPCEVWYRDQKTIRCKLGTRIDNDERELEWRGEGWRRFTVTVAGQSGEGAVTLRRFACPPGQRRESRGLRSCTPCEPGTHQPAITAATECLPCSTAGYPSAIECPRCPPRTKFQNVNGIPRCACVRPYAAAQRGQAGDEVCIEPPPWSEGNPPVAAEGAYKQAPEGAEPAVGTADFAALFRPCRFPERCLGANACVEGYAGAGCEECAETHAWNLEECAPREASPVTYVVGAVVFVLGAASPLAFRPRKLPCGEESNAYPVLLHHFFHAMQSFTLASRVEFGRVRWEPLDRVARIFGLDWEVLLDVSRDWSIYGPIIWIGSAVLGSIAFWLSGIVEDPDARLLAAGRAVGVSLRMTAPYLLLAGVGPAEGPVLFAPLALGLSFFFFAALAPWGMHPVLLVLQKHCVPQVVRAFLEGVIHDVVNDSAWCSDSTAKRASVWGSTMLGRRMILAVLCWTRPGVLVAAVLQLAALAAVVAAYSRDSWLLRVSGAAAEFAVAAALLAAAAGYGPGAGAPYAAAELAVFFCAVHRLHRIACCRGKGGKGGVGTAAPPSPQLSPSGHMSASPRKQGGGLSGHSEDDIPTRPGTGDRSEISGVSETAPLVKAKPRPDDLPGAIPIGSTAEP